MAITTLWQWDNGWGIRPCYRFSICVLFLCRFLPSVARRSVVALWLVPKLPRRPVHAWPPKLPTRLDVGPIDCNLRTCTCSAYSSDYTLAAWWKCAYTARNRIIARHTSDVKIPQGSTLLSLWVIFCLTFYNKCIYYSRNYTTGMTVASFFMNADSFTGTWPSSLPWATRESWRCAGRKTPREPVQCMSEQYNWIM
jgi:hypothetical protein